MIARSRDCLPRRILRRVILCAFRHPSRNQLDFLRAEWVRILRHFRIVADQLRNDLALLRFAGDNRIPGLSSLENSSVRGQIEAAFRFAGLVTGKTVSLKQRRDLSIKTNW